jgi:hypothetical protein
MVNCDNTELLLYRHLIPLQSCTEGCRHPTVLIGCCISQQRVSTPSHCLWVKMGETHGLCLSSSTNAATYMIDWELYDVTCYIYTKIENHQSNTQKTGQHSAYSLWRTAYGVADIIIQSRHIPCTKWNHCGQIVSTPASYIWEILSTSVSPENSCLDKGFHGFPQSIQTFGRTLN